LLLSISVKSESLKVTNLGITPNVNHVFVGLLGDKSVANLTLIGELHSTFWYDYLEGYRSCRTGWKVICQRCVDFLLQNFNFSSLESPLCPDNFLQVYRAKIWAHQRC